MLNKKSNAEKVWCGFHIKRGKGSMVEEQQMYNKLYEQYFKKSVQLIL